MKIVTILNGRELPSAEAARVRIEASYGLQAARILDDQERCRSRPVHAPDRLSVRTAMLGVESQLVAALWTLARLPDRSPLHTSRCGLEYIHDRADRFANAVANGGQWDVPAPRPSLPSARAIDAMYEPLEWLRALPPEHAKLVSTAAATKRGDVERNVSWSRVRDALPAARSLTVRTLQRRYEDGIRAIVAHLLGS